MTIFSILGHFRAYWGSIYSPKYKLISKYYFSNVLIWIPAFQNGLIEYSMNIFSDLIRYFVKMVIFIKKKIGILKGRFPIEKGGRTIDKKSFFFFFFSPSTMPIFFNENHHFHKIPY